MTVVSSDYRRVEDGLVERLKHVGVANIGEVTGGSGLMSPVIRPVGNGIRVAGSAMTCRVEPGDNLAMHAALYLAKPGDVLVITCSVPGSTGMWGGLATTAAQSRGIAGVVADGAVRDTDEIRELGFPVWSAAISPRGARKAGVGEVASTVVCGGVVVAPGDAIVADADGVVAIRKAAIPEILEAAEQRMAKEDRLRELFGNGTTPFEQMKLGEVFAAAGVSFEGAS